jgi:FkbM family methyltransferase
MGRHIRQVAARLTGLHVFSRLPGGVDFVHDVRRHLPNSDVRTIFDVGANVGQSARSYLESFRGATILCFEPVKATYDTLVAALGSAPNVRCFHVGMSASVGGGTMEVDEKQSSMNRLTTAGSPATNVESVALDTLDAFCARESIAHIDLLKIDTEGHDLEVLKGAAGLLASQAVDIIQVEAGMNRRNQRHVPIEHFKSYLEPLEYFLFRIYDQVAEWPTGDPNLRRSNLVFISDPVIRKNRKPPG